MNNYVRILLLCTVAFASTSALEHKFKLPENAQELITQHKGVERRSTLDVKSTDALVKAKAVSDNDEGVLPLFGPTLIEMSELNDGMSYCEIIKRLNYCEGEFGHMFMVLCPITCEQPPEEYCVQNDELAREYTDGVFMYNNFDTSSCESIKASLPDEIFAHDNDWYTFCEHPGFGIMCAETCQINCWYWPPPETTKVFLPGCQETVAIPTEHYPPQLLNKASPGDSTICPP